MNTHITVKNDRFLINEQLTYREIKDCPSGYHGLLMNARMIQGIFDDRFQPERFNRFNRVFSADQNTKDLIAALPTWYQHGLRAITVGFQGGGPCFTINNQTIDNNPFQPDGLGIDQNYLERMRSIIQAADHLGMVVIVSFFYGAQTRFIKDDLAIMQAVKTASNWLRDQQFTNVVIEVANEHDIGDFVSHPIIYDEAGMVNLIDIARRESGGMLVGCSGIGGSFSEKIAQASDIIIIHGNDQSRQEFYYLIQKAKAVIPQKPVICNEDSQSISRMHVALLEGVSWGYYNNMTKQEPPADWGITKGEDQFFAWRLASSLGLKQDLSSVALEDQFYLQGFEPYMTYQDQRWIRLASLYPETIDYVSFFRNGVCVGKAFDEPFMLNTKGSNWFQGAFPDKILPEEVWEAKVFLADGRVVAKKVRTTV